uniref:protein-tyrosine-phosphatase n=1 Tax=Romanomermis culicivorax TaxID=13658 RepID=A0A915L880_ROMCU
MVQRFVDSLLAYLKFFGERQTQIENSGNDPYAWEFLKIRIEHDDQRGTKEYSSEIGGRPENMRKNRYRDILPYDHSRVKITPYADDSDSDYINASLIKGANECIGYIATQGPMPETVNDFWQMTYEFGAKTILMLCDLFEGGKPKCHQYWPDLGSSAEYINTTVANTYETQPQDHFTVRNFTLTCYGRDQYILLHQTIALMFKHCLKDSCGITTNGDLNGFSDENKIADSQLECSSSVPDSLEADQQNATTVYLNGSENDKKITPAAAVSSPCRPPRSRKAALTSSIINQQRQQKPIHSDSCSSVLLCEDADRFSLTKNASSSSVFTHASNKSNRSSPERSGDKARSKSPCDNGRSGADRLENENVKDEILLDETLKTSNIDDIVFGDVTNNDEAKSDRGSRDSSSPNLQNKLETNITCPASDREKVEETIVYRSSASHFLEK